MKRPIRSLSAALIASTAMSPAVAGEPAGVRFLAVSVPARDRPLDITVWYPATPGGAPTMVGDSRLFHGTEGMQDAPVADGRHPLILVSHGSGGSIRTIGWIASHLATAGFIVAGPDHPGTTTGNSTPADTIRLWERPADISALLTAMLDDPMWEPHIDDTRIGAMGFSLGGYTVMALAGTHVSREAYARYCDTHPTMPDCVWFASGSVDMGAVDRTAFEGSSHDPRINAVVAVDPSVVHAMTAESLGAIPIPVHLVNLENPGSAWWEAVRSDTIARTIPNASLQILPSGHMSFLAECQPGAHAFLAEVGETDPLCDDHGDLTRAEVHAELADIIETAFRQSW